MDITFINGLTHPCVVDLGIHSRVVKEESKIIRWNRKERKGGEKIEVMVGWSCSLDLFSLYNIYDFEVDVNIGLRVGWM